MKAVIQALILLILTISPVLAQKSSPPPDHTLFGRAGERYGPKPGSMTFTFFGGIYIYGRDQALLDFNDWVTDIWNFGLRAGYAFHPNFELEAGLGFTPTKTTTSTQNVYTYLLDAIGQYEIAQGIVPYGVFGLGGVTFGTLGQVISDPNLLIDGETNFAINYGGGFKFFIFRNLALRPDFRGLTSFGPTHTAFMANLNLTYYMAWRKKSTPDQDRDGIPDGVDRCPKKPETVNGYEDDDGCPDQRPVSDQSGAVVPPVQASFSDQDGDGISDQRDQCPNVPETVNGFQDQDGCPDQATMSDQDQDGIPDKQDQCPTQPETMNSYKDQDGCPDYDYEEFTGVVEGINFALGSDIIEESSYGVLDRAVKVFKKYPKLKARIEGHTDSTGSRSRNLRLSRERAESVRQYLMHKGITSDRIEIAGYGPTRPVASNATPTGQARNRRVEFKLLNPEVLPKG